MATKITKEYILEQLTADSVNVVTVSYARVNSKNCEISRERMSYSNSNDQRAVTIECASDTYTPYAMNSKVYNKLIKLCIDICKRNKKKKLLWFKDKNKSLSYKPKPDEMVLTVHRWFANKSCPGDWLYSRLGNVAKEVTKALNTSIKSKENTTKKKSIDTIAREVINGKWGNVADRKKRLLSAGYDYNTVQKRVNELLE
ncbi:MAG: hypothetical protein MSH11_05670 [Ruminococcus sp.]|nr:hypothetical protein [Ruminococcus sp.]